jgi:hypothetical protein
VLRFSPVLFSIGVYFILSHSWCGVSRLLVEFLRVQMTPEHEIIKITRAERLLSFSLHRDYPQSLYLFYAQQSDKSPLIANNMPHLSAEGTGIHS